MWRGCWASILLPSWPGKVQYSYHRNQEKDNVAGVLGFNTTAIPWPGKVQYSYHRNQEKDNVAGVLGFDTTAILAREGTV